MVKLRNIVKNNSIIKCDLYPEDSKSPGSITCNIRDRSLIDYALPYGYEWCKNHVFHALYALLDMNDKEALPLEKTIMWV